MAKGPWCGVLVVKADVMLRGMADLVQHIRRPQFRPGGPDKVESLHSTDTIDTENSGTRGRPVWVHSRLLDSSVPAGEGGAVGNGVARSLGAEPGYAVRS